MSNCDPRLEPNVALAEFQEDRTEPNYRLRKPPQRRWPRLKIGTVLVIVTAVVGVVGKHYEDHLALRSSVADMKVELTKTAKDLQSLTERVTRNETDAVKQTERVERRVEKIEDRFAAKFGKGDASATSPETYCGSRCEPGDSSCTDSCNRRRELCIARFGQGTHEYYECLAVDLGDGGSPPTYAPLPFEQAWVWQPGDWRPMPPAGPGSPAPRPQ